MAKLLEKYIEFLKKMKKEKDIGKAVLLLLVASVLFGIAAAIGLTKFLSLIPGQSLGFQGGAGVALLIFLVVFLGGLFAGMLVKKTMLMLGGTGRYFEGMASVAYALLPLSVGALLVAAFTAYIPYVGSILAFLALTLFGVVAYAGFFRAVKELFNTDMITAFVGVSVVTAIIIVSFYVGVFSGLIGSSGVPAQMMGAGLY